VDIKAPYSMLHHSLFDMLLTCLALFAVTPFLVAAPSLGASLTKIPLNKQSNMQNRDGTLNIDALRRSLHFSVS
jgi:hypothetical protein